MIKLIELCLHSSFYIPRRNFHLRRKRHMADKGVKAAFALGKYKKINIRKFA